MTATNKPLPPGLILLAHTAHTSINHSEMVASLPEEYRALPNRTIEIDMADSAARAIGSDDWSEARRQLEEQYYRDVAPLLDKHPDYRIVYFGSAPIPLTVHLGALLHTWKNIEVIPHHHRERQWRWVQGDTESRLRDVVLPDYQDRSEGVAVIRVSTSHTVDPHLTRESVSDNPLVDLDIALNKPDEDAFSRLAEMEQVAAAFRNALDVVGDRFTGIHRVHLFASVQPGMALLLGAQISRTMHPPVQTYQYARNATSPPYHKPAILINAPSRPPARPLSDMERQQATQDREHLARDLERMQGLAAREQRHAPATWFAGLLQESEQAPELSGHWAALPRLCDTPVAGTSMDIETRAVEDSFVLNPSSRAWQIDDHWLARLAQRLPDPEQRRRALRLLVLHELAHRGPQRVTSATSRAIGRFPKVLEEIDYHADLWAMLYEHELARTESPQATADSRQFFMELIKVATNTMWAFDDIGMPLTEIQVRRLNRYLNWYWQYLHLDVATGDMTLARVVAILAQRPSIELAGPKLFTRDERIFFTLDPAQVGIPELGIYHDGKLHRYGRTLSLDILALLEAIKNRDPDVLLGILRAAAEHTLR